MNVACLIGNGPSIVYNPDLAIEALTTGIVEAFDALAGSETGDALATFASQVTGVTRADFESLLGPLDTITQALPALTEQRPPSQASRGLLSHSMERASLSAVFTNSDLERHSD
jgi:hypothetical protein